MAISRMQEPRQLYGLGSLVKKAVRGVKKIVKSPLGKAALLGGLGMYGMGAGPFSSMKGAGFLKGIMAGRTVPPSMGFKKTGFLGNLLGGARNMFGGMSTGQKIFTGLGAAALAAPFFMKGDEEEVDEESWTQVPSSIADIRNQAQNYYRNPTGSTLSFMPNKQFVNRNFYAADGGRAHLAPGGPSGGASAGGNYGGNVNPDQEYAGKTFSERYGGDAGSGDTGNIIVPPPDNTVVVKGFNWKNILPGGQPFYGPIGVDETEEEEGNEVVQDNSLIENTILGPATQNAAYDLIGHNTQTKNRADEILASMMREGGRVGLLNGGEAGQEQIEQMLMAEFVKYKNQGGTLTFEQFVQAIMQQQQEGQGMEQPQEVAMAANGGRIGYAGGQLVRPSADGSRPGYRGLLNLTMDNKRPPRNKFDFLYTTGPLNDEQKDLLQNMTEEDWKEADKGGFIDIILDILKTPYIIRGGETNEPLFADGGRIGAYAGGSMDEDEDEYAYNPQAAMRMYKRPGKQEGGIMETEVAEEMIDLGGKEKDYRETGGFVDLGGEERADDVPARLSKNEFVFTADAVRNAGGGDIDKGSEVMQNLMDNLEQGGEVSEESQGLEGAQAMYDQQQMLQSRMI